MLNELDIKILYAIYVMRFNYGNKPNSNELGFENNQHCVYHLNKLKELGYVDFVDSKTYHTGGINHEKYHNNVIMVFWENINILEKGIQELNK